MMSAACPHCAQTTGNSGPDASSACSVLMDTVSANIAKVREVTPSGTLAQVAKASQPRLPVLGDQADDSAWLY